MVKYKSFKIDTDIKGKADVSKVLMIYTGGTLGMVYDQVKKTLVPLKFEEIQKNIPELERFESALDIIPIEPPIDSSNMSPSVWIELATLIAEQYDDYDGFVILHGTDTMAHTASALSFLLENLAKPVILTGAQLPIGVTRTDARENMMTALELAADKVDNETILHEVCIYFNGRLLRGNRAKKYESSQFDAFQSENYPMLAEVGIYCVYNRPYMLPKPEGKFSFSDSLNRNVLVLKLFPGISNAFVKQILATENLEAVVLETYGSGNAPSDNEFLHLLKDASEKGIIIYNVSQCSGGKVRQGDYDTSRGLLNADVISGKDITTEAAVCKLMYLLALGNSITETKRLLQENLRGEVVD
ncbi:asparaginase [uncultured Arcticibacterium sp.]|uniref:asparaginase n=1 Tax=uncultured Arcticibacterium sp. TaxID=2173042 RepID=UPI0030F52579